MPADTKMVMAHRKRSIHCFNDVGATAPQRAIIPTSHHVRQRLIFESLIKDKVPVNNCCFYLDESREVTDQPRSLEWLTVFALLLFVGVFMYIMLQWHW